MTSRREHREALQAHLQRQGLKWTRQREAIVSTFLASTEHLTVEDVQRAVARSQSGIGLATVYRTMKLLVEADVASERHFQDGVTRYEVRQPHHDHLICLDCGTIVEFEDDAIEALQDGVASKHGFELVSHRHELYGRCTACRKPA